jgi:hypothetical protein
MDPEYSHFLGEEMVYVSAAYEWFNPYIPPPHGIRHMWAASLQQIPGWQEYLDGIFPYKKIFGYSLGSKVVSMVPRKKMSPEGKASIRKKRLEKRVKKRKNEKQLPLFPAFEDMQVEKKISEKPEYYSPEGIKEAGERHDAEIKYLEEKIERDWIHSLTEINNLPEMKLYRTTNDGEGCILSWKRGSCE